MKQDEIIEAIFKKFDSDGSGSLDLNECVDLFKQNKIKLDKNVVKKLLGGDEFTLQKFKGIISSDRDLQRFKDVFNTQRERIKMELEDQNDNKQKEYVPFTFETLMESFGKKLQRKILFEDYVASFANIQKTLRKKKMVSKEEIIDMVEEMGEKMFKIIDTSSVETCSLKNNHNQLYLSLMQGLDRKKKIPIK
jgi:Ca2+-binding EF-hand superfamily protein